jgi:uncharacterized membrane protein
MKKNNEAPTKIAVLVQTLLRGILAILPLIIIVFIFSLIFDFIFDIVKPLSHILDPGQEEPHWIIHVLSMLIIFFMILTLGLALNTRTGKGALRSIEYKILRKIPMYSLISDLVVQISGLQQMPFSKVVLIDPYNTGILLTGFVAEECAGDMLTVFVPTAPNPTNGNIYHVPLRLAQFLELPPQIAMQTIVGMGTGSGKLFDELAGKLPQDKPENQDTQ